MLCLGGISNVGSYHEMQGNGLLKSNGRSWTAQIWWILSGSILAAAAEALHLKGSVACAVTRLAMLVVSSVVITEMRGNGLLKSTRKGLGQHNFGSFQ
jgi:hypothetical protein